MHAGHILFSTGLQLAEAVGLEIGDVHFSTSVIEVRGETAKGGKERVVPLFPELSDVLQRYVHAYRRKATLDKPLWITQTGDPLTREGLRGICQTIATMSGVAWSPHLARQTYAHTSLEVGMDVMSLSSTLGHANLSETFRYSKSLSAVQLAKLPSVAARFTRTEDLPDGKAEVHKGKKARQKRLTDATMRRKGRLSLAN